MDKIDTKKLFELGKSSRTAKDIVTVLSERERASKFTNLAGFRHQLKTDFGIKIVREDYDAFWEGLEAIGIGRVILSAQKVPMRFNWEGWNSQTVGLAALDPKKHPERAQFRVRRPPQSKKQESVSRSASRAEVSIVGSRGGPKGMERIERPAGGKGTNAESIFAIFRTQNSEAIRLELKKGFTAKDRDDLIELLKELPVRSVS